MDAAVQPDASHSSEPRHLRLAAEHAGVAAEEGQPAPALAFTRQADGSVVGRCAACGVEFPVQVS